VHPGLSDQDLQAIVDAVNEWTASRGGRLIGDLAFGVVGLGFGANHARVLGQLEGVRLLAVCDTDERRLAAAAGRSLRGYTDFETMLTSERLDAVVVAVPAYLHEAVALAAFRAGCAVLVEKPLAPSLEDGRRLVRASDDAGVALMAGHIERFNPALQALARRVRAGDIGRVLQLTARRSGAMRLPPNDVNVVTTARCTTSTLCASWWARR
jgi:predicted dehydrogenase